MATDTLVYHVCEKTGTIHIPDVSAVYAKIVELNAGTFTNIFLNPEYNGHAVWADELAWMVANFGSIPIMLDIAGGWEHWLTLEEIAAAVAALNIKSLRIAELISYCIEEEIDFPTAYITSVLEYCAANNLEVYWCEWKVDWDGGNTFKDIITYIAGYEDIVTVAFKTNSGDLEPYAGFEYVKAMFTHWGATVESWYWHTRHKEEGPETLANPDNMPISWLVRHACEARDLGAEIIQFEPYWYFFGKLDGKANDNLVLNHYYLNSAMSMMETSINIMKTIFAEWLNGPAKANIHWINSRVDVGFGLQPSAFEFVKAPKKYAIGVYSLGSSSPSPRLWLKVEDVAVDILAKVLGTTIEKASLDREKMRVEVERIIHKYSAIAPLWDPNPGPTGAPRRRRVPGLPDVVISQQPVQIEDKNFVQVTVYVRCRVYPNRTWI